MSLHLLDEEPIPLRPVHAVPDPLGNYFRPGFHDQRAIEQALAEERGTGTGLVINPVHMARQRSLVLEARKIGVESVLDVRSLELSTPVGLGLPGIDSLPWAPAVPHTPTSLKSGRGAEFTETIAGKTALFGFDAVLAPTHLLDSPDSTWWQVDAELTRQLRAALDDANASSTRIYYPLMMRASELDSIETLEKVIGHLRGLPIDAVWLRLHPFGTQTSGPLTLKRYLVISRALHQLSIPIVADRSGAVGVALMAVGAVGGVESGVTFKDKVDFDSLLRPSTSAGGFSRPPRVYLNSITGFLEPDAAPEFFRSRGMAAANACTDAACCPRGWHDMVSDPRGHFLRQRSREISELSRIPGPLRGKHYLSNFLNPASDRAARAAEVSATLVSTRKRLESWKGTLSADLRTSAASFSKPAAGRPKRRTAP